jgi:hypothetical protein
MALDMGSGARGIACDSSCGHRRLVLCGVSLIWIGEIARSLIILQPHRPSAASDGHSPHTRSALSRITAVTWQHRARRSSPHPYAHAASMHRLPTSRASLSSHSAAHVHRSVTFCGGLPRGRGGKFEQIRACVCRAHWRGFLGQRTPREDPRSWCGEGFRTDQEKFQIGACVPRICLQGILGSDHFV